MRPFLAFAILCVPFCAAGAEYDRALDLYNHTEYQASIKLLLPAHQKTPAELALIGQDYFMLGDARRATEFFQKAVAAEPGNSGLPSLAGPRVRPPRGNGQSIHRHGPCLQGAAALRKGRGLDPAQQ